MPSIVCNEDAQAKKTYYMLCFGESESEITESEIKEEAELNFD